MLKLHSYWRSSAAYRVRIALNLKGLDYEQVGVHLVRDGGEQHSPEFRALNPNGLVPVLEHDGLVISQSLAIIEYLDEQWPQTPLLPADAAGRARVRALAMSIACDLHPLNNLRVLKFLEDPLAVSRQGRDDWYRHWVAEGFAGLERTLADSAQTGRFCHGDVPGLADACLIPQLYNAHRFNCPLEDFPTLLRIGTACAAMESFDSARPERQPDAV